MWSSLLKKFVEYSKMKILVSNLLKRTYFSFRYQNWVKVRGKILTLFLPFVLKGILSFFELIKAFEGAITLELKKNLKLESEV